MTIINVLALANAFLNSGGELLSRFPAFCLLRACELTGELEPCSSCIESTEPMQATVTLGGATFPVSLKGEEWVQGWI